MYKLIINADDFGYSRGVNYGIIDAYRIGVLTSTTMMTNMPGVEHGVELAKENPGLGVGVHLVLTCGKPLLENHKTLVDVNGNFHNLNYYKGAFEIDLDEIYKEWKAQIERFISFGLEPTHLDSHHHINSHEKIYPVFLELAKEYNLPIRNNINKDIISKYDYIKTTDYFAGEVNNSIIDIDTLRDLFKNHKTVEIMTHPAYLDKHLIVNSSFTYPRVEELELLTNKKVVKMLKNSTDIKLITFKEL